MGRRPAVSTAVGCLALVLWCCSVTVPSLASADLLRESVVVEPATGVAQGEKAWVRVEITNQSDEPIHTGYVLLEDAYATLDSIPAGATQRFELPTRRFNPWGGSNIRRTHGGGRLRSVPYAAPNYPSALGDVGRTACLAQGCLERTVAMYEYLRLGAALVCVESPDVPAPFGVKDRSYDVNHVQLARQIVFPKDGSKETGND